MWSRLALDASMSDSEIVVLVPVEGEGDDLSFVTGMNFMWFRGSSLPRDAKELVCVFHPGGQDACEEWCDSHAEVIDDLKAAFAALV